MTSNLNGVQRNTGVSLIAVGLGQGKSYVNNDPKQGIVYKANSLSMEIGISPPANGSKGRSYTFGLSQTISDFSELLKSRGVQVGQ